MPLPRSTRTTSMKAILLTHLLAFTTAYVVPADLPDGTYIVPHLNNLEASTDDVPITNLTFITANNPSTTIHARQYNDDGTEHSFFPQIGWPEDPRIPSVPQPNFPLDIEYPPIRDNGTYRPLEHIDATRWDCFHDARNFNPRDIAQARASMMDYCDRFLVPMRTRNMAVSKYGNVVVYVCNWEWEHQICDRREYAEVEGKWLNRMCGTLGPGFVAMDGWKKAYGRAYVGMRICPEGVKMKDVSFVGEFGRDGSQFAQKGDGSSPLC